MVQTDWNGHKHFTPFLPQAGPWEMSFGSQDTVESHLPAAPLLCLWLSRVSKDLQVCPEVSKQSSFCSPLLV